MRKSKQTAASPVVGQTGAAAATHNVAKELLNSTNSNLINLSSDRIQNNSESNNCTKNKKMDGESAFNNIRLDKSLSFSSNVNNNTNTSTNKNKNQSPCQTSQIIGSFEKNYPQTKYQRINILSEDGDSIWSPEFETSYDFGPLFLLVCPHECGSLCKKIWKGKFLHGEIICKCSSHEETNTNTSCCKTQLTDIIPAVGHIT